MTGWSIRVGRTVGAPVAAVWPHLATAAGYSVWACPGADHYEVRFDPREGVLTRRTTGAATGSTR